MTAATETNTVQKSITVNASLQRAFDVFTAGIDSWWPRTHHIGKSPMTECLLEGRAGGRCYSKQEDGAECDWGTVLTWEPPHRFVMAWQVTHQWGYQADLSHASEVEVNFTQLGDGRVRVDLEHRHFERMGPGGVEMRTAVNGVGGWETLLQMYAARFSEPANA